MIFNFALSNFKNNQYDYSQYRHPLLRALNQDCFTKTITFSGKEEELKYVSPSREQLEKLYKHNLTCLCCGRVMLDPEEIKQLKASKALNGNSASVVKVLEKYKDNMHSVEKEVFEILKEQSELHPNKNFREILQLIKPEYEEKLIQTQFGIFKLIDKASENINPEQKKQIKELINEERNCILNGDNQFRRKRFVNRFEKIFKDSRNSATKEHLIKLANKLPTSYEDKNAFIVKYSNRKPEDIAFRLLSYSLCTIEHVKPKNKEGQNHLFNYIPECMRCNSFRQDRPMIQQLEEHPEMFYNAQTLIDKLIDFANDGKLSKWYIMKITERVRKESDNMLNLDISRLNMNSKMQKIHQRQEIELDEDQKHLNKLKTKIETKRLTKKGKKLLTIKKMHKIISQHKKEETNRR